MLFLPSADFFKINFFEKFFQEYHQSVQIKPEVLSSLIWVQLFAKVISRQH